MHVRFRTATAVATREHSRQHHLRHTRHTWSPLFPVQCLHEEDSLKVITLPLAHFSHEHAGRNSESTSLQVNKGRRQNRSPTVMFRIKSVSTLCSVHNEPMPAVPSMRKNSQHVFFFSPSWLGAARLHVGAFAHAGDKRAKHS